MQQSREGKQRTPASDGRHCHWCQCSHMQYSKEKTIMIASVARRLFLTEANAAQENSVVLRAQIAVPLMVEAPRFA